MLNLKCQVQNYSIIVTKSTTTVIITYRWNPICFVPEVTQLGN